MRRKWGIVGDAASGPAGEGRWHLLVWERNETDGTWRAWVSRVQEADGRRVPEVVQVRAGGLRPLGLPEAYQQVRGAGARPCWAAPRYGADCDS